MFKSLIEGDLVAVATRQNNNMCEVLHHYNLPCPINNIIQAFPVKTTPGVAWDSFKWDINKSR